MQLFASTPPTAFPTHMISQEVSPMAILKSIFAENYASFADRVEFSCESVSKKKDHMENTATYDGLELNLVSYIYGANGSGKSYLCRIIQIIKEIISSSAKPIQPKQTYSARSSSGSNFYSSIQPKCFLLDTVYLNKPTKLGLELVLDGIQYHYEFSVLNGEIVEELLQKKRRRTETILSRTSPDHSSISVKSELKDFEIMKHFVRKDALCLASAALLNNKLANDILSSIWRIGVFNMTAPYFSPPDIELFSDTKMERYIKILKSADPTLESLSVNISEQNTTRSNSEDDFENKELVEKRIGVRVQSEHAVFEDGKDTHSTTSDINFFSEESLGTIKLFTTLPYLFDALENGDVLILDEIENGLHLKLVKEIISLFLHPSTNPKQAQLICTSHQPLLLDGTNPKRDQVWIVNKNSHGKSSLSRLSDYPNARLSSNLSKMIIDGAFGCNPEPFFDQLNPQNDNT